MIKPEYAKIFAEINANRPASLGHMSADLMVTITTHVEDALKHIATQPALTALHEGLSQEQINASVKQYATELANGQSFGDQDPHLRNLLTVTPATTQHAAPPTTTAPMAHLLRNPANMRIFRDQVNTAASKPTNEGYKAALWLKPQLDTEEGRQAVIGMFEKISIMQTSTSTDKPSSYADNPQTVDKFLSILTRGQRAKLYDNAIPADPISFKSIALSPSIPKVMSRRAALGVIGAAITGVKAITLHTEAVGDVIQASGAPLKVTEKLPKGKANQFFGEDPEIVVAKPENQAKLAAATNKDQWAVGYAVGTAALLADAGRQLVRRSIKVNGTKFKDEVASILKTMDPLVIAAQQEVARRETGAGVA